jgi:hypothetical protein
MISLDLARQLKEAGLVWEAGNYDFFAIPDRDMDDRIFVITDIMTQLGLLKGWPVVTFYGTAEWALDYILTTEVIWLPTEEQLREALLANLPAKSPASLHNELKPALRLWLEDQRYHCEVSYHGASLSVSAPTAGEAYAQTLLALLRADGSLYHVQ